MAQVDGWETKRSRVRRKPERARYDRESVFGVIDEALHCHVGVLRDGAAVVLPTIHARIDETIYLHGSPAAGHLRDGRRNSELCVTFTIVDGLALTRSARNHSLSYRSAVVFGPGALVRDPGTKMEALRAITEHIVPGRWEHVRQPTATDLNETEVIAVSIREASMKSRSGPPLVDETDGENGAWAGVIPLITVRGAPEPASFATDVAPPIW